MNKNSAVPDRGGVLYLVGTPIGNLEDVTFRAVRLLKEVGLIAAEDTRKTRILLGRYDINSRLTSFNARNGRKKVPELMDFLKSGRDLAIVSEAGTPAVSDPGGLLVRAALEAGVTVRTVPGASSVTAALSVSGLPAGAFYFLGFLPKKAGKRKKILEKAAALESTIVIFEPARSLVQRLQECLLLCGDRQVVVCREMTKLYEEIRYGRVSEMVDHYTHQPPRGEVTIVISPG
ncbi:16S rRNA (cytidine(1402)-2'-O)-methyltransferase [candidate division KSB1 bacterium]